MYGGKDREWSNATLETIVAETLASAERVDTSTENGIFQDPGGQDDHANPKGAKHRKAPR